MNVNGAVYKDFVLNKVLPAIQEKWPSGKGPITIQEDGARPHKASTKAAVEAAAKEAG